MSVLILADEHDPSADAMVHELGRRDAIVHRLDLAWFPQQLDVTAEVVQGRWEGWLRTPHRTIALDTITAVWWRSPRTFAFPAAMTAVERHHATMEAKYGLGGVLTSLPALWVNHPARVADAAYKPFQLALASRCGLRVPATLITNDADSVRRFASAGRTVTKMLGASTIHESGEHKIAFTRLLDAADVTDLAGIENTAHLFQRWAPKSYECRVIVVGDTLTAVGIHASSASAFVDWRTDYDHLHYELLDLPDAVATGARRLMKELGLAYGALDFVVAPDRTFTFLEVNPTGQYGWLEYHTGAPITAQLAALLTGGTS